MDTNIFIDWADEDKFDKEKDKLPDWLTDDAIKILKDDLNRAIPYTDEEYKKEVAEMWFDVPCIDPRIEAYNAQKTLKKYGLI